jgi:hypothetical protein
MGRWLGRDPIEEGGGLNLFGMLGNDLIGNVDVLGKYPMRGSSPIDRGAGPGLYTEEPSKPLVLPKKQVVETTTKNRNESQEPNCCGPDATDWFVNELRLVLQKLRHGIEQDWADPNFGPSDSLVTMAREGGLMDSFPLYSVAGCASGACKGTFYLFGFCMDKSSMNNILYGFVSNYLRISPQAMADGAVANNVGKGRGFETYRQSFAYADGRNLLYHMESNPMLDSAGAATIVNAPKMQFLENMTSSKKYGRSDCPSCNKTVPVNAIGHRWSDKAWIK